MVNNGGAVVFQVFILIILSIGSLDALIPLFIIMILIAGAAGAMRGFSIFNAFGIGTFVGLGPGTGVKATLAKSGFPFRALLDPNIKVFPSPGVKKARGERLKREQGADYSRARSLIGMRPPPRAAGAAERRTAMERKLDIKERGKPSEPGRISESELKERGKPSEPGRISESELGPSNQARPLAENITTDTAAERRRLEEAAAGAGAAGTVKMAVSHPLRSASKLYTWAYEKTKRGGASMNKSKAGRAAKRAGSILKVAATGRGRAIVGTVPRATYAIYENLKSRQGLYETPLFTDEQLAEHKSPIDEALATSRRQRQVLSREIDAEDRLAKWYSSSAKARESLQRGDTKAAAAYSEAASRHREEALRLYKNLGSHSYDSVEIRKGERPIYITGASGLRMGERPEYMIKKTKVGNVEKEQKVVGKKAKMILRTLTKGEIPPGENMTVEIPTSKTKYYYDLIKKIEASPELAKSPVALGASRTMGIITRRYRYLNLPLPRAFLGEAKFQKKYELEQIKKTEARLISAKRELRDLEQHGSSMSDKEYKLRYYQILNEALGPLPASRLNVYFNPVHAGGQTYSGLRPKAFPKTLRPEARLLGAGVSAAHKRVFKSQEEFEQARSQLKEGLDRYNEEAALRKEEFARRSKLKKKSDEVEDRS